MTIPDRRIHWDFLAANVAGGAIQDQGTANYDGTLVNSPTTGRTWWQNEEEGFALSAGSSQLVQGPTTFSPPSGIWSVACFVKYRDASLADRIAVALGLPASGGPSNRGLSIRTSVGGTLTAVIGDGASTSSVSSTIRYDTNEALALMVTWDGSDLNFYIRKQGQEQVRTLTPGFTPVFNTTNPRIELGRDTESDTLYWDGDVFDFSFWDGQALSLFQFREYADLHLNPSTLITPNVHWDMGASRVSGSLIEDQGSDQYDATLVNSPSASTSNVTTTYADEGYTLDGSSELVQGGGSWTPPSAQDWGFAVFGEANSAAADAVVVDAGTDGTGQEGTTLELNSVTGFLEVVVRDGAGASDTLSGTQTVGASDAFVVICGYDDSTNLLTATFWVAGSAPEYLSTTVPFTPSFVGASPRLEMGRTINGDTNYWDGDVYDLRWWNGFLPTQLEGIDYGTRFLRSSGPTVARTANIEIIGHASQADAPVGEADAPILVSTNPPDAATGVSPSTTMQVVVDDLGDGVDLTSATLSVQVGAGAPVVVYTASAYQNGYSGSVTPSGTGGFTFDITPPAPFPNVSSVQWTINVSDLSPLTNQLVTSVSWTTADTTSPFLTGLVPGPGSTGVAQSTNITLIINDAASVVQLASVTITVDSGSGPVAAVTGGVIQPAFAGVSASIAQNVNAVNVVLDPSVNLPELQSVTVAVQAQDAVGNALNTNYSFTTADNTAPALTNQSPAPASVAVPTTPVSFRISDPGSGIVLSSLGVTVNSGGGPVSAVTSGSIQAAFNGAGAGITGTAAQYDVTIQPTTPLPDNQAITVEVTVDDVSGNTLLGSWQFTSQLTDVTAPTVINQIPAPASTGISQTQAITFTVMDNLRGVDPGTINVTMTVNATPSNPIVGGVIQAGFTGSITPNGLGYDVVIDAPGGGWGDATSIQLDINASDQSTPANVMSTVTYSVFTNFQTPVPSLSQVDYRGILGSIVQLDGRDSVDPGGGSLTYSWQFIQVPAGSVLEPDLNASNPASIIPIRDSHRAVSFIPDLVGEYVVRMTVSNGGASASADATVVIGLSLVPCGEGVVPDMRFIWQYMSNFYQLLEDREVFQVVWSALTQIIGSDFTVLHSNNYNKSLSTIQPTVMRRWQRFPMSTDLIDTAQSVVVGNTTAGTTGVSGTAIKGPGLTTRVFRVRYGDPTVSALVDDFTQYDINYGVRGRVVNINGTSHTVERAYNRLNELSSIDSVFTYDNVVFSDISVLNTVTGLHRTDDVSVSDTLWAAQNDYVYFGSANPFDAIALSFSTVSPTGLSLTFEHSDGAGGWTSFSPSADGSADGTSSGEITFSAATVAAMAAQTENGANRYWVRVRRTSIGGTAPVATLIQSRQDISILVLSDDTLVNNLVGVPYRMSHLLHTPSVNLETAGVSAGDYLVLEFRRKDTGQSAELPVQITSVDGTRAGFEFSLATLADGARSTLDHALFRQLVQDIRLVTPDVSDIEIAGVAEVLIRNVPLGVNVASQPFMPQLITVKAKRLRHNSQINIDDGYVSIPCLQYEISDNPSVIYCENRDYVLTGGNLVFQPGIFSLSNPSPDELWAECSHVDNNSVAEDNFGRLVNLKQEDLTNRQTQVPYISAIKGLWYALTNGPTVDNLRLALQILMGLPFTESRGIVIANTQNYSVDSNGNVIARLLMEDVDDTGRRLGVRRIYFYPQTLGLAVNPATGATITIGDIVEAFLPLSLGVTVEDVYNNSTWWLRNLKNNELRKFFVFKAEIDTESGVFDEEDLAFSVNYLRQIKPAYTDVVASVVQRLDDANILTTFTEGLTGTAPTLRFYENVGGQGAHGSTLRTDDDNAQGAVQWRAGSRPFATVSPTLLTSLTTSDQGGNLTVDSGLSMGNIRGRQTGTTSRPTIEGDILVLWPNQPGSGTRVPSLFEMTAAASDIQATLGSLPSLDEPRTWTINPSSVTGFTFGANLTGTVIRRAVNPVTQASDLSATAGGSVVTSSGSNFILDGVAFGDILVIETGPDAGAYRVVNTNALTTPRSWINTGTPQFTATTLGLVNMDGTVPTLSTFSNEDFRVIRPHYRRRHWPVGEVTQVGGAMRIRVYDFGATPEVPFDVFSPDMIGTTVNIFGAQNPQNDGDWVITAYINSGEVTVTGTGVYTSDSTPQARIIVDLDYGFEDIEDLTPTEAITVAVS